MAPVLCSRASCSSLIKIHLLISTHLLHSCSCVLFTSTVNLLNFNCISQTRWTFLFSYFYCLTRQFMAVVLCSRASCSSLIKIHLLINTHLLHSRGVDNNSVWGGISSVSVMGGSPGDVSENLWRRKGETMGWRMNCDVSEATEGLENELWRR